MSAVALWPSITVFTLFGTVAEAFCLGESSLEWELSGILGGSMLRPPSARAPPGVAAFSFLDETRGTGSPGESGKRVKQDVVVMKSGILEVEQHQGY